MFFSHCLALCGLLAPVVVHALPEVNFRGTTITGRDISNDVEFYGGIPFAEPPVGALRLRPPVPKIRLNTTSFDARDYGKACIQPPGRADPSDQSEDCLNISIHRPSGVKPSAKLPVLFWTYGGAFMVGASNTFNGSGIVQRSVQRGTPIIYVNFNYRVGPLGYPQGQEADDQRALNLGIKDEIAALEWVQANIHFFGGDKDKVTISGSSAGSVMTAVLFLNPNIERLARGAIFLSGSPNSLAAVAPVWREGAWQNFVTRVPSCASVAKSGRTFSCLQNATTEEITAAASVADAGALTDLVWTPNLDTGRNSVFPELPSRLYSRGRFAKLPFIAGNSRDEGTVFSSDQPLTDDDLKAMLLRMNGSPGGGVLDAVIDKILELYPADPTVGSPYGTGDELFGLPESYKRQASILGDIDFSQPRRAWSQAAASFGVKTFAYQFTDPQPGAEALGVTHGSDILYVYGQLPPTASPASRNLSVVMMDYWISFVVSLDPNDRKGAERPRWPQYKSHNQVLLQLEGDNTTVVQDDFRSVQMAFLKENAQTLNR